MFEDLDPLLSSYDRVYIGRMLEASEKPKLYLRIHDKVVYYETNIHSLLVDERIFPSAIAKARPDYNLYSFRFPSEYTQANFLQFSNYDELIKTQDSKQHNLVNPVNIIMDQSMWSLPKGDLISILKKIKNLKKIHFMYPIDFSALFDDDILQTFLAIPLTPKVQQNFQNFTANWVDIIKVQKTIKESGKHLSYLIPKIKIDSTRFFNVSERYNYIKELILIGSAAKREAVRLEFDGQGISDDLLKMFVSWSKSTKSLVDFGTSKDQDVYRSTHINILNSPKTWSDTTKLVVTLLNCYPDLFEDMITGWQGIKNNINQTDIQHINGGINDLFIL